jgi:hypothetical protein
MNIRQWLPVVSAIMLCCVQSAFAQQSLEQLPDGALRHVESNWVFPETIGNFKRSGVPTAVGGIASVIYTRPIAGVTAMATLMVTPTMNRSAEAAFEEMKATTAQTYKSRVLTQLWSSGPFKLSDEPKLIGRKAFFKLGVGSVTGLSNQYLIATDKWMVRIRTSSAVITPELIKEMDAFVRALLWDRLTVSGVCQGFDCKSEAVRFHAAAEEQYTVLRLEQGKEDLFPPSQIPCDSQTIASWLNPPPVVLESGADGRLKPTLNFWGLVLSTRSPQSLFCAHLFQPKCCVA